MVARARSGLLQLQKIGWYQGMLNDTSCLLFPDKLVTTF
jgi:hypothetical protein